MCLKKLPKNFFILTNNISGVEIVRKRRTTRGQPRSKPSTGRGLLTPQVLQDIRALTSSSVCVFVGLFVCLISVIQSVCLICARRARCLPQVAIMTPDMASYQAVEDVTAYSQEQDDIHPVTLLATSNGTHIAVQVG